MSQTPETLDLRLAPEDNIRLANLTGQLDAHLRQIERRLGIEIANRGHLFRLIGEGQAIRAGEQVLERLYAATAEEVLTPEAIHLQLQASGVDALLEDADAERPELAVRLKRALIRARGPNQQAYLDAVMRHDINFGVGPAGTGKTYLAVACAVEALETDRVRRVLLVRPAVEAGERLGFLPGDLAQKIDPYLRPLYDALYEMLGFEKVTRLMERHVIEVAPLAYMRGRTLNDAFIILDEAQNTTPEQMKMFLTRIGFGSTAVITGDVTQVDLPRGQTSGLRQGVEVLRHVEGISFTFFNARDVVRHALVQRIVNAYDAMGEMGKVGERVGGELAITARAGVVGKHDGFPAHVGQCRPGTAVIDLVLAEDEVEVLQSPREVLVLCRLTLGCKCHVDVALSPLQVSGREEGLLAVFDGQGQLGNGRVVVPCEGCVPPHLEVQQRIQRWRIVREPGQARCNAASHGLPERRRFAGRI